MSDKEYSSNRRGPSNGNRHTDDGRRPNKKTFRRHDDDEQKSYKPHSGKSFHHNNDGEEESFHKHYNSKERPLRHGNKSEGSSNERKPYESKKGREERRSFDRSPNHHSSESLPQRRRNDTHESQQEATTTPRKNDGLVRLNKYIANAGICSRREADVLIAAGSVTVNGEVVTEMGYKVKPGDVVGYGGETLRSERKRYFLLNKPKGFITTLDDPQDRHTVMTLIDSACKERIYPVGRLDRNTTGLLLFTNDGELARRLTHPSTRVYKIYQVELNKPVSHDDMQKMLEGLELEDGEIHVDDVQYVEGMNDKRIVGVVLHSGKNRIVRRIFEHLGYEVHKLDRVVFAGLTKKDLPRGRYRELTEKEVGYLKMV